MTASQPYDHTAQDKATATDRPTANGKQNESSAGGVEPRKSTSAEIEEEVRNK